MAGIRGVVPSPADARAQAEAWYARLNAADCLDLERQAFARWHARPGNAEAYAATERLLSSVDALAEGDARLQALMQQVRRRPAGLVQPRRRWSRWAAVASVALLALLGMQMASILSSVHELNYAASEQGRRVALEDGSALQLDTGSRVAVRFGRRQRSLELSEGRALFEVAHDASRPFVVHAGTGSITALGTRFQVQHEGRQIIVTLAEGAVTVTREAPDGRRQQARLQPGQELRWSETEANWMLREADTDAVLGWSRGRLIFRGTPLAEVVAEANRYATRKVVLGDPALADLPVHGNFIAGDADAMVAALGAVLPLRVEEGRQEIRLHRR
ncbi:FecR domain-containing protein [Luteimonas sp. Y-2-2-4F]|nr:FecR domain-containing protein [Luteimonas sp. Y-2-2-4F]MCD9032694.1 FecR domain-containing protein [Luteimonas sp. Y-2-2-4F]